MTEIVQTNFIDVVASPQIDFKQTKYDHPSKLYTKITPIGGTTAPSISITSQGTLSEFQIPSKVVNFSEDFITFKMTCEAGATGYNFINGNLGCTIDRIILSTIGSNCVLADISNVGAYLEACDAPQTKYEDFKLKPSMTSTLPASPTGYTQSTNDSIAYEDISRSNSIINTSGTTYLTASASGDDNGCVWDGVRRVYAIPTSDVLTNSLNFKLPLSMFKSTIMSVNKQFYFAGESLNVAIYWSALNSYSWFGTSLSDLTTGAAAPIQMNMSALTLYSCVEQNQYIVSKLVEKVNTEGLTLPVPVVWSSKQNIGPSTEHSATINITKSHGNSLLWCAWSPFNNATTLNTCKGHTTYAITQYQTLLNQIPIISNAPIQVVSGLTEHWLYNKDNLKGSAIKSLVSYNNAFVHFDNFTGFPLAQLQDYLTWSNGISLVNETQQYQLSATTTSTTLNHYFFWACQKQLIINRNGVMLV